MKNCDKKQALYQNLCNHPYIKTNEAFISYWKVGNTHKVEVQNFHMQKQKKKKKKSLELTKSPVKTCNFLQIKRQNCRTLELKRLTQKQKQNPIYAYKLWTDACNRIINVQMWGWVNSRTQFWVMCTLWNHFWLKASYFLLSKIYAR